MIISLTWQSHLKSLCEEWTRTVIRLVLHRSLRVEVQHLAYDIPKHRQTQPLVMHAKGRGRGREKATHRILIRTLSSAPLLFQTAMISSLLLTLIVHPQISSGPSVTPSASVLTHQ